MRVGAKIPLDQDQAVRGFGLQKRLDFDQLLGYRPITKAVEYVRACSPLSANLQIASLLQGPKTRVQPKWRQKKHSVVN